MTPTTRANDEAIRRDVVHELRWDPRVQDLPIGVAVDDAVVTLTGTVTVTLSGLVETWADRRALVGAARLTRGVRAVDDRLTVEP